MTMITPSYLGETIEYSSLHACRSTLEDPTSFGRDPRAHPGFAWVAQENHSYQPVCAGHQPSALPLRMGLANNC